MRQAAYALARRPGRRGDGDPRPLPVAPCTRVVLYHARGLPPLRRARGACSSRCGRTRRSSSRRSTSPASRSSRPRYRERIPVVEVDGREAFTYFVHPDGLRRRLGAL